MLYVCRTYNNERVCVCVLVAVVAIKQMQWNVETKCNYHESKHMEDL